MPSDPNTKIPLSESLDNEINRLLSAGLENFSVRELLGMMLSAAGQAERSAYLAETTGDKGNGSYDRSLNVGSIPVDIRVPRTRSGQFRPNSLPPAYERGYSDEVQSLLFGVLCSARSVNAAKTALRKMGVNASPDELDTVASDFIEELELVNSRPIDPDMGDVLRFLSKKNDVWFPKLKPVPVMGTEKENHTSWERYYRVSDCSSSSRNNWYLGR